jgi:hypothetical protein
MAEEKSIFKKGSWLGEKIDSIEQMWKDFGDITKLSEEDLNEKIRYLKGRIKNTTKAWKKRYRVQLAALEKQLAAKTDAAKPAKPDAKPTSPETWKDAVGAGKLKDEHRTRATSTAGEVEGNVEGAKAQKTLKPAVPPKPKPRPSASTKYEPKPHNLGRAPEGYLRGFIDTQPPATRPIPGSSDDTGAVNENDQKAAARKKKDDAAAMARKEAARKKKALPNAPRPSGTAGSLQKQIKEDLSAKIIKEKKSAKSKSSWRRVKDDGGPDDWAQGKRVYDTPFGRITVDSSDEGMDIEDTNLRKGGTTKKKASSKKKAAPVQKYGFRQGSFTARGGMYKVKG